MTDDARIISNIAQSLQDARETTGWTQSELAVRSGVGRAHISLLENGRLPLVSIVTMARLSVALGVGLDWLVWRRPKKAS